MRLYRTREELDFRGRRWPAGALINVATEEEDEALAKAGSCRLCQDGDLEPRLKPTPKPKKKAPKKRRTRKKVAK